MTDGTVLPAPRPMAVDRSPTVALFDEVQRLRARGVRVVDLSKGEPDFATPEHISAAAIEALHRGQTHYTPSRGLPALRDAIAAKLLRENDVDVDPGTGVLVTPSAKHALFVALAGLLAPGDEVLVPSPAWVSYAAMAGLSGARAVPLELGPNERLSAARLHELVSPRTRVLLVNSPNNPTGHMLDAAELEAIVEVARRHDLVVVSDEIYEKIAFDGRVHRSVAAVLPERTLTVNGFSKGFAMTGWRLGYLAGPAPLLEPALVVHEHSVSCAASFAQHAGIAALEGDQGPIEQMRATYERRRDTMVRGLAGVPGLSVQAPQGTFYLFLDIQGLGYGSSADTADALLSEAGVVVVPGTAFGAGGEGRVRLSFATADDELDDAVARFKDFSGSSWGGAGAAGR